jgi:ligand-binding SRPBCC domain-containing protein
MADVTIQKAERGYRLHAECIVPRPIHEVFAFFSNHENLEELTPSWMRFEVLTPPCTMHQGQLIDYRLRIRGVPLPWQSEITVWEPPSFFVDEQRRGPYRFWRHEHRFEPCDAGTRVLDDVRYAVPGGPLIHVLLVRRDLERIFRFRQQKLLQIFPAETASAET